MVPITRTSLYALFLSLISVVSAPAQSAQATFDVATIRPSRQAVPFEHNGRTEAAFGTLRMQDVTVDTCIHWAYGTPTALIFGPSSLRDVHYDITAKTDPNASQQQMRLMLQALLADRFKLHFHKEPRVVRAYTLTVAKSGIKMHPSAPGGAVLQQNSATGMVARSFSMPELADYLSDALQSPLADATGLSGGFDFTIDFTPYVDMQQSDIRPDVGAVITNALKGELGLEMSKPRQQTMEVTVVDHMEPPSSN